MLRRGLSRATFAGFTVLVEQIFLIRPMTEADLALLREWRSLPHVSQWWGVADGEAEAEAEASAEPGVALWIAELDGRPFAFIQDYDVDASSPHPFDYLPSGARGMDLYIGEPDMLGRGFGAQLVRQHVDYLFGRGCPAVGMDPHPHNLAARRTFESAGFSVTGGPMDTPWGPAILMDRRRPYLGPERRRQPRPPATSVRTDIRSPGPEDRAP
jgi:aminoglycoside 6'-N-acetyltransferase